MKKIPLKNWLYVLITAFIALNGVLFFFFEPSPIAGFLLFAFLLLGMDITLKEWRKRKNSKFLKIIHYLFYSGFSLGLALSIFLLILIQSPQGECKVFNTEKIEGADTMIILGAGLKNGEIEEDLKNRLDLALKVIQGAGKIPQSRRDEKGAMSVVVTGGIGWGEVISEAEAMGAYLVRHGVPAEWIIYEKKSTSTFENFEFGREQLNLQGGGVGSLSFSEEGERKSKILLITSDFHIFRASLIARYFGFEPIALCSRVPFYSKVGATLGEVAALAKDGVRVVNGMGQDALKKGFR